MKRIPLLLIVLILWNCKNEMQTQYLKTGTYRAVFDIKDNIELPFNFEVESKNKLKIFNAEEVITVDEIEYRNDSVFIKAPVFEGYFAAVFDGDDLKGDFVNESLDRVVPFKADYNNKKRFSSEKAPQYNVSGTWETVFSKGVEEDEYVAKGIFEQSNERVTGTFRTPTGDYRYLEGVMDGDTLKLSTFDGAHVFLFNAKITDSTMNGIFYSGNHWEEPFEAKRNENFELPNADSLTFLKEGYDKFSFSFPNANGTEVSLEDERFKNKVVVVQIMGTWCPNCLDETKYYKEFYNQNKNKDFEIVALAFEYAKDKEKAFKNINRLKDQLEIKYPILLAQYGTSSKTKAQEKLPMLNHVLSYPTSIFIDKKGKVRKIHTGFNGPATGEKYQDFKKEFENFVSALMAEK